MIWSYVGLLLITIIYFAFLFPRPLWHTYWIMFPILFGIGHVLLAWEILATHWFGTPLTKKQRRYYVIAHGVETALLILTSLLTIFIVNDAVLAELVTIAGLWLAFAGVVLLHRLHLRRR